MTLTATDILKGPVTVYYAPVGEANPDPSTIGYGDPWGGNWVEVGYTEGALAAAVAEETHESEGQQSTHKLNSTVVTKDFMLEFTLKEITADHVQLVTEGTVTPTAPGAGQVGLETLTIPDQFYKTERAWGFEARHTDASGNNLPHRVFVPRATSKPNGNHEFAKDADVGIPIQVMALKPATGDLWTLEQTTAPASS
jgi:hypothetical protein